MPYYGVPIKVTYEGVTYDQLGFAFNRQIVTDLLRDKLGFKGYVNSDTGIINERAWGLEGKSVPERAAAAVNAGVDVLSGFNENKVIPTWSPRPGAQERVDEAARRLLLAQFKLGLFDNPYVDAARSMPLSAATSTGPPACWCRSSRSSCCRTAGRAPPRCCRWRRQARLHDGHGQGRRRKLRLPVTDGNYTAPGTRPSAAGHDAAFIRVQVTNPMKVTLAYRTKADGGGPGKLNPRTGKTWGAEDPCISHPAQNPKCVDDLGMLFGGAFPWEANNLSFTTMAAVRVLADLAFAGRYPGGDARSGRRTHGAGDLLPPALRARRGQRLEECRRRTGHLRRQRPACWMSSAAGSSRRASCPSRWRTS
jgi:beta-glucosidase